MEAQGCLEKGKKRKAFRLATEVSPRLWAGAVFVLALCFLLLGFFRAGRIYPVDYGQYERILTQCGLTWTPADLEAGGLQYVRPVTRFQYAHFSWPNLLTPQEGGGLVVLTALCRLILQPLGLEFSLQAVAAAAALVLAAAAALLAPAARKLFPRVWYWPVAVLMGIYADGNFCVMLRGLYPEGAAAAFFLLAASIILRAFSLPEERRGRWMIPAVAVSFIALKTFTPLIVFLPLALAALLVLLRSCHVIRGKKYLLAAACALLLVTGTVSTVRQAAEDPDYFSGASAYHAVFQGMLPASEEPEKQLEQLGLEKDYAEDIGKSYYQEDETYVHPPRQEGQALADHLCPGAILGVYARDPGLLGSVLDNLPVSGAWGFESTRNMETEKNPQGFSATRALDSRLMALRRFIPHSWRAFSLVQVLLLIGGCVPALWKKQPRFLWISLAALCAGLYLPFCVMLNGYEQSQQYMLFQVFLEVLLLAEILCLLGSALPFIRQWLTRYARSPYQPEKADTAAEAGEGRTAARPLTGLVNAFAANRKRVTAFTAAAACLILVCVMLPANHPVGINNGDFGRMMAQMDLTWTGDLYFDEQSQMGHGAIEEFAYLRPWDPLKLTPLKPAYSLYWFVSAVRLMTEPFGLPFSTWLLAWIMGLTTVVCAVRLVWDLYPLLKKAAPAAALLLLALLFSETALTWYNSLYGEGCILLGLLMTLTCAVHLCLMPREKSRTRGLWLFALAWSLQVMVTAKAQMVMAVPGAVALLVVLNVWQKAYRYDLRAVQGLVCLGLCAVLVLSGAGVYQTDRTEDSVSQKHTMWQAYFYGIFMISDDPVGDMEALGVDTAMAADIGKYVDFSHDEAYVYAPLSREAEEAFYNHVSMGTILGWYVTHPAKLWRMLDHAAAEARELYNGFRVYRGQDYSHPAHDEVNGWNFWPGWRVWLTPGSFLGYFLFYLILLILLLRGLLRKGAAAERKILYIIPLFLILTAVLQFPLSVLGNGFADNRKQLFAFALCHDVLTILCLTAGGMWLWKKQQGEGIRLRQGLSGLWRRRPLRDGQ